MDDFEQNQNDPLAETADPDDPFAEVEPDLPEGVEPGSLGGVNPSEEAEEEEFLEEPAETDEVEEEPDPDPLGESEPGDPDPLGETDQGDSTGFVSEPVEDTTTGVPASEESDIDATSEEPEPEAEPEPEPPKAKKSSSAGKRDYTILRRYEDEEAEGRLWEEVMVVAARSGDLALRQAYRRLTEADGDPARFELVPVPSKLFNPKVVEGRVPQAALAIKVG